jgi:hypothetical protein
MKGLATEIVSQELDYIRDTINQSVSDRNQMLSFYITITGALASVIIGLFSLGGNPTTNYIGGCILSYLSSIIGIVFWYKFRRLRQAWHESLIAFNHIKSKISDQVEGLDPLFYWHASSIPKMNKPATVHYYASFLVMLLAGSSFVASLIFALLLGVAGIALLISLNGTMIALTFLHSVLYKIQYEQQ